MPWCAQSTSEHSRARQLTPYCRWLCRPITSRLQNSLTRSMRPREGCLLVVAMPPHDLISMRRVTCGWPVSLSRLECLAAAPQ